MLKITKMLAVLVEVSVLAVSATAAMGAVNWDGSAGTGYWNDPVPTSANGWGNWDGDPATGPVDLDLGASNTKVKSDISGWSIGAVDLWPSSGTAMLTIENGGYLQVGGETRLVPDNTNTHILVQGGVFESSVVYGGYLEISGTGTWTGGRAYSGPSVHVMGSNATVTPTSIEHNSLPVSPYKFTLDAGGVSPIAFTNSNPIADGIGGIALEVAGIGNYAGSVGDIIQLITFPGGVTDNDIINLFPSGQWVYDDTLATLTVDNLGVRLEIIPEPATMALLVIGPPLLALRRRRR